MDIDVRYNNLINYINKKEYIEDISDQLKDELKNIDYNKIKLIYDTIKLDYTNEITNLCGKYKIDNIILYLSDNIINPDESISDFIDFRSNQTEVFNYITKNGISDSGIVFQYMGSGKTPTYLHILEMLYNKNNTGKRSDIYIVCCERKEILEELDFKKIDKKIINSSMYKITNYPKEKLSKDEITMSKRKPNILIINNASLKIIFEQKNLFTYFKDRIKICIVDECHCATAKENYNLFTNIKKICPLLGFSATPIRKGNINYEKMANLFGNGQKVNFISIYTMIDSINDGISLPFKYYMIPQSEIVKDEYKKLSKIFNEVMEELPYKKIVIWCRNIIDCERYYSNIKIDGITNYITHSYDEDINKNESGLTKFSKIDKNGILFCVNRCKEGCNIKNLDCGVYLEGWKNKGILVRLQSSGRINRKDKEGKKTHAIIIEFISEENKDFIFEKIINDVLELYNETAGYKCMNSDQAKKCFDFNKFLDGITFEDGNINMTGITFNSKFFKIDQNKFNELKKSIRTKGLKKIDPLYVEPTQKNNEYYVFNVGNGSISNYLKFVHKQINPIWGLDSDNSKYNKYYDCINKNIDKSYVIFLYDNTSFLYKIKEVEKNEDISLTNWKDSKYSLIIRLEYMRELNINKNQIYEMHGYKDNFALRGMMCWKPEFLKILEDKIIYHQIIEYDNTDVYIGGNNISKLGYDSELPYKQIEDTAFENKCLIIVKCFNGKWYLKGKNKDYENCKNDIIDSKNKYPKRKCWLIKYV